MWGGGGTVTNKLLRGATEPLKSVTFALGSKSIGDLEILRRSTSVIAAFYYDRILKLTNYIYPAWICD